MKLNFQGAEFNFKDEAGNKLKGIFHPRIAPEGRSGKFYRVEIYKNDELIGEFLSATFINKTNAGVLIVEALEKKQ